MAVMERDKWTDERLDDLNEKVDRGFAETKAEMREGFARVDAEMRGGFARVDADIRELRQELKNMNRTLIGGLFVLLAAIVGSNVF